MKKTRENKGITEQSGITLIALVVTVIVLIILAAVTINLLIGSNGIITRTQQGTVNWEKSEQDEKNALLSLDDEIEGYLGGSTSGEFELLEETEETKKMKLKLNISAGDELEICTFFNYYNDHYGIENNTNFDITWGSEGTESVTVSDLLTDSNENTYISHTFSTTNAETIITIDGTCQSIGAYIKDADYPDKVVSIEQWGATGLLAMDFYGASNLIHVAQPTKNTFKDLIYADWAFSECTSLETIPDGLFANATNLINANGIFSSCTKLKAVPNYMFYGCTNLEDLGSIFEDCEELNTIGNSVFEKCTEVLIFHDAFNGCYSLTAIPSNLFNDNMKVERFIRTFANCYSLTGNALTLWERVPTGAEYWEENPDGEACYIGCEGLSNWLQIPSYWKEARPWN